MSEKKAIFMINILKNIINVYFDTFFVFYFFKVANYEVLPLAKYYLSMCLFGGIGFFLIRKAMKKNIKVPYFRIGISLQAIYIALIMLLKDQMIHHIYLIGIIKGIADGFYYFPKNILDTEKVNNHDRQKFDGFVNVINQVLAIIIPLILGVLLTYISYVNLGKVFFVLFIIMFILSFFIDDSYHVDKKMNMVGFRNLLKKNKKVKYALIIPCLMGFTYSSGVLGLVVTLSKINNFKSNLNLGFVDSICAFLSLMICVLYSLKIKPDSFKKYSYLSGIVSFIVLFVFAFWMSPIVLIIYLFIRYVFVKLISLISNVTITNLSNSKEIKEEFKTEFYLVREIMLAISRCLGYLVLLIVCLIGGMKYINYILIIPAFALLLEALIIGKLNASN